MPDENAQLKELIASAQSGNEDAANRLFVEYRPFLRLLAEHAVGPMMKRREDASDIVQQTELEAFRAIAEFRGNSEQEFSAWMKQILRRNVSNLVRDNWAAKRDQRREKYLDNTEHSACLTWLTPHGDKASSPSQHVIRAEAALQLAKALDDLPEVQRIAVRMRHLEGCSLEEISTSMDKTPPAIAGLIRRGLQTLRERLAGDTSWI